MNTVVYERKNGRDSDPDCVDSRREYERIELNLIKRSEMVLAFRRTSLTERNFSGVRGSR